MNEFDKSEIRAIVREEFEKALFNFQLNVSRIIRHELLAAENDRRIRALTDSVGRLGGGRPTKPND